jgi:acyl carrier protein
MGSQQAPGPEMSVLTMSVARPDERKLAEADTASRLARLWGKLLGVESVGLNENYFDLGGDSALIVHLFSQIEKVFNVRLPVTIIFEAPTVVELAKIICEKAQHANHP